MWSRLPGGDFASVISIVISGSQYRIVPYHFIASCASLAGSTLRTAQDRAHSYIVYISIQRWIEFGKSSFVHPHFIHPAIDATGCVSPLSYAHARLANSLMYDDGQVMG